MSMGDPAYRGERLPVQVTRNWRVWRSEPESCSGTPNSPSPPQTQPCPNLDLTSAEPRGDDCIHAPIHIFAGCPQHRRHRRARRRPAVPTPRGSHPRSETPPRCFPWSGPGVERQDGRLAARSRGWQPVGSGIPTYIGSAGLAPKARDTVPATPMGVCLDFAFGTSPTRAAA